MKKNIAIISTLVLIGVGTYTYNTFYAQKTLTEEKVVFEKESTASTPLASYTTFVPTFTEVTTPFVHAYNKKSVQMTGGSLIDINNDGVDEVFIGGGLGQNDALLSWQKGAFVDIVSSAKLSSLTTTYSSFVGDFNNDNYADILVGREDGIHEYINKKDGTFSTRRLPIIFESNTVPLNISGGDINNDDIFDLYISTFADASILRNGVFNDDIHARANILLLGKGNGVYEDITVLSGTFFDENTFISSFVDLNNDGFSDIVVAPDTSRMVVYKNNGNLTFTKKDPVSDNGFWMGLALGDIDNDGDVDIFASNVGNTIRPERILRGDLRKDEILDPRWRTLRNDGDFTFTDITQESKLAEYEFAWGALFEDFNLDTIPDLVVMENYIKWPPHRTNKLPGRFFIGTKEKTFLPTTKESAVENAYYGMTPLSSDFNGDGYPDLIYINLDGPTRAFMNTGGQNKGFAVIVPLQAKYSNARIIATLSDGSSLSRQYTPSQGLASSQSNALLFALPSDVSVKEIIVQKTNGETEKILVSPSENTVRIQN